MRTVREGSLCLLLHHPYVCGMREMMIYPVSLPFFSSLSPMLMRKEDGRDNFSIIIISFKSMSTVDKCWIISLVTGG